MNLRVGAPISLHASGETQLVVTSFLFCIPLGLVLLPVPLVLCRMTQIQAGGSDGDNVDGCLVCFDRFPSPREDAREESVLATTPFHDLRANHQHQFNRHICVSHWTLA